MVVDGKSVPHTNITILINEILRKARHEIDPVGRKALIEKLRKTDVPHGIVGNTGVARELASKRRKFTRPRKSPLSRKSQPSRIVGTLPHGIDWQ